MNVRWIVALSLASFLAWGSAARAQPTVETEQQLAERKDAARVLAQQGLAKIDAGEIDEGVRLLEAAEARFHAPTHVLFLAQAYRKLGKPARAMELYDALLAETLPDYAPNEFREAQRIGASERAALASQCPRIVIVVAGSRPTSDLGVVIDGGPTRAWHPEPFCVDLGAHEVVVTTRGGQRRAKRIELASVEAREVTFTFEAEAPTRPASPFVVPGAILLGFGGAGVVAAAITGGLALKDVGELSDRCPTKAGCDTADEPIADESRALGNASTVSLVIGGAAAVVGIVLVALPAPERAGTVRATLTATGITITGAF